MFKWKVKHVTGRVCGKQRKEAPEKPSRGRRAGKGNEEVLVIEENQQRGVMEAKKKMIFRRECSAVLLWGKKKKQSVPKLSFKSPNYKILESSLCTSNM